MAHRAASQIPGQTSERISGSAGGGQQAASADAVPALRRSVLILDLVAGSPTPLTAAEITRALSLPKSTAHGLLNVMMELNLLARNPDGSFRPGPHPMRWAHSFLSEMDIVSIFRDYFARDTALSRYTMTLTVLERGEVVYIGCRDSGQPLGHSFRIGMRLPAPFTATGKMLLSELPDEELLRLFEAEFPAPMTPLSVRDLDRLRQELAVIRARGFSIDDGQIREGMICICAPVRDHSGKAVAGIATSLIQSEASADVVAGLGETVRNAARDLSTRLGHTE